LPLLAAAHFEPHRIDVTTLQNMAASFHKAIVQEIARPEKAELGELV